MELCKKCFAEFLATLILVTLGCGTAISTNGDIVATALAFGLSILVVYYVLGKISGGHANPAVSLAMAINKKITWKEFGLYIASQFLGALLAVFALRICFGTSTSYGANLCSGLVVRNTDWKTYFVGFTVELILSFVFIITILAVSNKKEYRRIGGLVIGLVLVLVHLFGISLTGTSVNPARALMPGIFAGGEYLKQVWIFVLAPFAGGAIASLVWKFLNYSAE